MRKAPPQGVELVRRRHVKRRLDELCGPESAHHRPAKVSSNECDQAAWPLRRDEALRTALTCRPRALPSGIGTALPI